MSIQSEIERISQAKTDIHSAIESKGVTVPDDTLISEMAPYIQQIREAGTVVTSVSNIGPDESGNAQLENLRIYCGEQDITYNGGAEQTLTINPSTVGAATAAQGALADTSVQPDDLDDYALKTELPTVNPNPYSLGVRLGASEPILYDGRTDVTVNITPNAIGAATSYDLEALQPLVGTTSNTTPLQVYNALSTHRQCFITYQSHNITFSSWVYDGDADNGVVVSDGTSSDGDGVVVISLSGNVSNGQWSMSDTTINSVPITRRITVTPGWSTSYGDTGTDFKYGRIVSFDGSTTSHEVTGIYVTGQNSGSSPADAQKTAASTWAYVECENNQLHFYSPTLISTTFYLIVTIQKL